MKHRTSFLWLALALCLTVLGPALSAGEPRPAAGLLPAGAILVPPCRQDTAWTCRVAATQSLLCFYTDCDWQQNTLTKKLHATYENGTSYKAIRKFFEKQGYTVDVRTDMTLEDLEGLLDDGKPVLCLIQAWAGKPVDYSTEWKDGHYVVAIGYDAENVYFMDPSTLGNYTFIPAADFLARWHDVDSGGTRLVHFGMVVWKPGPHYNPQDVLLLG